MLNTSKGWLKVGTRWESVSPAREEQEAQGTEDSFSQTSFMFSASPSSVLYPVREVMMSRPPPAVSGAPRYLPALGSKLVCARKTLWAEKSTASLLKLRWQLTEVSGRSLAREFVWADEQEPARDKSIVFKHAHSKSSRNSSRWMKMKPEISI